jgi:hypothetical protein
MAEIAEIDLFIRTAATVENGGCRKQDGGHQGPGSVYLHIF